MVHLLSQGKGVEIHGCGLLDRAGRAYLFVGQSGAGKSTMARLWVNQADVSLLSDERVVLRTDRDPIAVYGTPWQGDAQLASPQSGKLAAVFFLNRGADPCGGAHSRIAGRRPALLVCVPAVPQCGGRRSNDDGRGTGDHGRLPATISGLRPIRTVIDVLKGHMA